MDDIGKAMVVSAEAVRAWGRHRLPDGRTVEEALTVERVPFWSVLSPSFAFGHVSQVLLRKERRAFGSERMQLLAKRAKRRMLDLGMGATSLMSGGRRWPASRPFLFLGFTPHIYRETMKPVAQRVASLGGHPVVVLDDSRPGRSNATRPDGLDRQSLWQNWNAEVASTARTMRSALAQAGGLLASSGGLPAAVESSGLVPSRFHGLIRWLTKVALPRAAAHAAIARHIIARHRPVLIISPDVNDPRTRVFCLEGKLASIRSLEVQFGFYGPNDVEWRFFEADHLAVTGQANLEVMKGHGIPAEKMTVTGSPRYDEVVTAGAEVTGRVRARFGVSKEKVMLLFASQPFYYGVFRSPEARLGMIRSLLVAAAGLRRVVLVIKPHPLERAADLRQIAKGHPNVVWAEGQEDIRELIRATDAFVTFFSGTTFDALVMGKPAINLAFPGACANPLFEDCGATTVVRSPEQVAAVMRTLDAEGSAGLSGDASRRESFLRDWFYELDGQASRRIEALALRLAAAS
jgi:CDP-Glycerol:Poly(glycerophosphate) glycerophosphotransferase